MNQEVIDAARNFVKVWRSLDIIQVSGGGTPDFDDAIEKLSEAVDRLDGPPDLGVSVSDGIGAEDKFGGQ